MDIDMTYTLDDFTSLPMVRLFSPSTVEILYTNKTVRHTKASLLIAIENIQANRSCYATQAAYDRDLMTHQNALRLLDEKGKP